MGVTFKGRVGKRRREDRERDERGKKGRAGREKGNEAPQLKFLATPLNVMIIFISPSKHW